MQKQMEENRRKYVQQARGQLRMPQILSAQKVNQLKAKLGLSQQAGFTVKINHKKRAFDEANSESSEAQSSSSLLDDQTHHQADSTSRVASFMGLPQQHQSSPLAGGRHLGGPNELLAGSEKRGTELIGAPLSTIPKTDFECTDSKGRFVSGLFADHKTGCQVWHLCSNNRKYSFLCPSGTIFNAKLRICDWRYNVKCENPSKDSRQQLL